jgi:hypothetical protein
MGKYFLTSYKPLIITPQGRMAAAEYGLPPFIDASCRGSLILKLPTLQYQQSAENANSPLVLMLAIQPYTLRLKASTWEYASLTGVW